MLTGARNKYLCNEDWLDELFILSLFHQSTSTCFGRICSPSSGGILYIYNWYVLCFSFDNLLAGLGWNWCLLMMGYKCAWNVEVDWQNKLRINSASSWFLLHRYIEMHSQQNIKFEISTFKPTVCYFRFIFIITLIITPLKGRRVQMNLCLYLPYLGTDFGEISCWRLSTHNDTGWLLVLWNLVQWKP